MPEEISTPMLDQWRRMKREHKGTILFFRCGDFYEMFAEDAVEVSGLLNLTLTSRNKVPLCGVPYHAARVYLARLLRLGKKVAVCEQMSEPGKGLVERKVVEVVTPGTTIDEDFLDKGSSNYLACFALATSSSRASFFSFAYIDISAGDFYATSFPQADAAPRLRQELERLSIKEIIVQESLLADKEIAASLAARSGLVMNRWGDWLFDKDRSFKRLRQQFGSALKGFGLDEAMPEAVSSGALLDYLDETAGGLIPHVKTLRLYQDTEFVSIDESSRRNLELTRNLQDGDARFSLLEVVDETRTAMGRRLLKRRLAHPLRDIAAINSRLDVVETLYRDQRRLEQLRDLLGKTPDLERLRSRLAMDKAHGKDMLSIKNALASFQAVNGLCGDFRFESPAAASFGDKALAGLVDLQNTLEAGICDEPSILLTEGNLIRLGYSPELDDLRKLRDSGHQMLEAYLEEERLLTGITTLKIRFNRLIGYYFEVTNAHLSRVPKHFIKRQGLAGAERYSTDRLQNLESDINGASDKIVDMEKQLFLEIRDTAKARLSELEAASVRIAEVDAGQSLARAATLRLWSRPVLHNDNRLDITESRHPVVEAHLPSGEFIPNDIRVGAAESRSAGNGSGAAGESDVSFILITGPNMAGKSTYLRQTALIVIMAQMGSFVPAREAHIGIVDRVYCRVGAQDNLARGESTFLVEMNETAYILNTASEKSLVIMDEVGRGTGTNDGLSIAWAVSEELLGRIRCRTLFATHYHELASLSHPQLANRSMEVLDNDGELVFLRKLKEGAASESYGLHAAKLAGLPACVLDRAAGIMEALRGKEQLMGEQAARRGGSQAGEPRAGGFDGGEPQTGNGAPLSGEGGVPPAQSPGGGGGLSAQAEAVIAELAGLDPNALTPLNALTLLHSWRQMLATRIDGRKPGKKRRQAVSESVPEGPELF